MKNVVLIQPPDPPQPVPSYHPAWGARIPLSPPWDLHCVKSYIAERTRHNCSLIDCRLCIELEQEIVEAIKAGPKPDLVVINTSTVGLGQSAAILEIVNRHFPGTHTAISGQHPSQFPSAMTRLGRAHFALCGDPEPILHNLLDNLDIEQRLQRVPGLIYEGCDGVEPYWLQNLKGLSLPSWEHVYWGAYEIPPPKPVLRVTMRLSRGHTRSIVDRAFGQSYEPVRFWPFERVAPLIGQCTPKGVTEVFIDDPPGMWTVPRLEEWCVSLARVRNTQPWALQVLPAQPTTALVEAMRMVACKRVYFNVPSCQPKILERYGCTVGMPELAGVLPLLKRYGIDAHVNFWVGGPEEDQREVDRIAQAVRTLQYCSYSLRAFPFNLDMPIYEELSDMPGTPDLEAWIKWARDPWIAERPVPIWGGQDRIGLVAHRIASVRNTVLRSPRRIFKHALARIRSTNWISVLEEKALDMLPPPSRTQ